MLGCRCGLGASGMFRNTCRCMSLAADDGELFCRRFAILALKGQTTPLAGEPHYVYSDSIRVTPGRFTEVRTRPALPALA